MSAFQKKIHSENKRFFTNINFKKKLDSCMTISGSNINYSLRKKKKTLAIINTYNEVDIINETIAHLLDQEVDVCIVDNYSTDGTYEKVYEKYKNCNKVIIRRFKTSEDNYEWFKLLKNTEDITHEFSNKYDWFIHQDSDELRYSPFEDVKLGDMISFVDSLGYNAIDHTVLNFRYTKDNRYVVKNYEKNLKYFEFGELEAYFLQIRGWRYTKDLSLAEFGGHEAVFPNRKVYPLKFLLKHYPLRNHKQAQKKIFKDRGKRLKKEQLERGWHTHYNGNYTLKRIKIKKKTELIRWSSKFFQNYLIERLSGIGLKKNDGSL